MRRWVGLVALTFAMGGCDFGNLCDELDGLCGGGEDGGGDEGGDDGEPPGDDGMGDEGMGEEGWADEGPEPPGDDGYGEDGGPIDPCLEEYEWCLQEVGDESCEEILQWCEPGDPPPEPIDPCLEEYEWCLQEVGDESCEEILQWCEPGDPPDPSPCDEAAEACFAELDTCFVDGADPEQCDADTQACLDEAYAMCEPPGDPGDPGEPPPEIEACFEEADACFLEAEDPQVCDELLTACLGDC